MAVIWRVVYSAKAQKDLDRIDAGIAKRVILLMDEVASNPYGLLERMRGSPFYKLRIGQYRVVVDMVGHKSVLHVAKVKHRSQAYKK